MESKKVVWFPLCLSVRIIHSLFIAFIPWWWCGVVLRWRSDCRLSPLTTYGTIENTDTEKDRGDEREIIVEWDNE